MSQHKSRAIRWALSTTRSATAARWFAYGSGLEFAPCCPRRPFGSRIPRASFVVLVAVLAGPWFSVALASPADDQYAVAAGHYARQRWDLAAEEFQRFLDDHPEDNRADASVFYLAEALLQSGETARAEARFRQYLQRQPEGKFARAALFRAGEAAYLTENTDRAETDLARFLKQYPGDKLNAYVLPYLGDLAMGADQPEAAARYFRRALGDFPKEHLRDDCRFGLARALEKLGQANKAAELYSEVAGNQGSALSDDAQFHLGVLLFARGRFAQAEDTFGAFERDHLDSRWRPRARLGRGWALMKLGKLDQASELLARITADEQVGAEARYWMAMIDRDQQRWSQAAQRLLEAAEAAPADHPLRAEMHFYAADSLLRAGDIRAAAGQFEQVVALAENHSQEAGWLDDAVRGKIQVALEAGNHEVVEQQGRHFEQRFPDSPLLGDVRQMLARALIEQRKYQEAVDLLVPLADAPITDQRGLEQRYLLATARKGLGQLEEALADLQPILKATADDPGAATTVAEGTSGESAQKHGSAAPNAAELRTDAHLLAGMTLLAMERYADAVTLLEDYLATATAQADPADGVDPSGIVRARGALAICLARTGQLNRAKDLFVTLRESESPRRLLVPVVEQLAEAAYAAGDHGWSTELFDWLRRQANNDPVRQKGISGLAWSQMKAGKLEEAARTFGQLLDANPSATLAAEAALARGRIFQQLDKLDAAVGMYDLVIQQYPKSDQYAEALLAAARLRHQLQQDREAAGLYTLLSECFPNLPEMDTVLYEWSWVRWDLGESTAADELLEKLRREHPNSNYWADATYRLASRAFATEHYDKAEKLAAEVVRAWKNPTAVRPNPIRSGSGGASAGDANPGAAPLDEPEAPSVGDELAEHASYLMARVAATRAADNGNWDLVRQRFQRFLDDFPESPMRLIAEFWVAETLYRQQRYEPAAERFSRLARQIEGRDEAWLAMIPLRHAQLLAHQRRWREARDVAAGISKRFPNFQQQYEAEYVIGRALAAMAELEDAREAYRRVLESPTGGQTETAAMARWMIGETYFHQKKYDAAMREFLRLEILHDFPKWQAAALLQAGKCRELLGEPDRAAELYREVLTKYKQTEFAQRADQRLRQLQSKQGNTAGRRRAIVQ